MSRRHRKPEEESSLELLLDTMCNTFGGVMFIAISLFVVASAMTQIDAPPVPDAAIRQPAELRTAIARLETLLAAERQRLALQEQELAIREEAPEQQRLREIALLEKLLQEQSLRRELLAAAKQTDDLSRRQLVTRIEQFRTTLREQESQLAAREQEALRLKLALDKLTASPIEAMKINFKVMQNSVQAPFFLLLRGDRVWKVGPWLKDGAASRPDDAVNARTGTQDGRQIVICVPKPETGIPVFSGAEPTAQFRRLLAEIPPDRVPKFVVSPDAAATGYKLREYLKNADIRHGCSLAVDNTPEFTYIYQDKVQYEY